MLGSVQPVMLGLGLGILGLGILGLKPLAAGIGLEMWPWLWGLRPGLGLTRYVLLMDLYKPETFSRPYQEGSRPICS